MLLASTALLTTREAIYVHPVSYLVIPVLPRPSASPALKMHPIIRSCFRVLNVLRLALLRPMFKLATSVSNAALTAKHAVPVKPTVKHATLGGSF